MAYGSVNIPGVSYPDFRAHTAKKDNPHTVTKAQIGLGNVDNTSDLNKPISTAVQTALNGKSNPNLLDNWYFADPINQRGETRYTSGFMIDRWWAHGDTTVVTVQSDCVRLQSSTLWMGMRYAAPDDLGVQPGDVVTFSIDVKSAANFYLAVFLTGAGGVDIDSASTTFHAGINSISLTVPANYTKGSGRFDLYICTNREGTNTVDIKKVKFERGSFSTLKNDPPPNKASELLKCQRYYFQTGVNMFFSGMAWTARISGIVVPCPVPLRALPAMTLINNYAKLWIGSSLIDTSHLTFRVETMDSAGLRVAADSDIDLPLGSCCLVDFNAEFSADI